MPKTDRFRALYVLKYLWEHTDEEHPVMLAQIQTHLSEQGIEAISKTIDGDITALQDLGFDIIRNRSTQYQYFFASRHFSSFELKLMIDAVQAAKFIPQEQTEELVERIAQLANKNQSEDLSRNLFVSKLKDNDKNTLTMADWLHTAINRNKQVTFQYYGYDREGKKSLRFDGYRYKFSPYALVWNMDSYIVIRQQNNANDGDIVAALVNGESTLKRIFHKGKKILLHPENKEMKDITVDAEEIVIQGVLVSCIKMY